MCHLVQERGLENRVEVDSAGTSGYHIDEPADKRMRAAAKQRGITLLSRSRKLSRDDFAQFDVLIAMDRQNYREMKALGGEDAGKVQMMSDYLDTAEWSDEVPDPYFGGDEGFEHVLDMLQAACPALLESLIGSSDDE